MLFGLLLAAGCSSGSSAEPGGDDTDASGACRGSRCPDNGGGVLPGDDVDPDNIGCTTDTECPSSAVCDVAVGRCAARCSDDIQCGPAARCGPGRFCVPRTPCTTTDACSGGEVCNTCLGVCDREPGTSRCLSDANCGFDEICDTCNERCAPRLGLCEPCLEDRQCGEAGDRCLDYTTGGRWCGSACGTCPAGYRCDDAAAQCVAISGSCERVRGCTTPADCPAGQTCSPSFQCVEGCTGDEACPQGQVCASGACVPPCEDSSACTSPAECVDRRCQVPGGCLTSRDCLEPETYCDISAFQCVPGCQVDNDCGSAGLACIDGSCARRGCAANWSCGFGEVCEPATGDCVPAEGPYCDACNGSDVNSCGNTNACLRLQDQDGNELGDFCYVACEQDPVNACPQGYQCREIDLGSDGMRRVCTRQCDQDPV
jgi:hypothetical protein